MNVEPRTGIRIGGLGGATKEIVTKSFFFFQKSVDFRPRGRSRRQHPDRAGLVLFLGLKGKPHPIMALSLAVTALGNVENVVSEGYWTTDVGELSWATGS